MMQNLEWLSHWFKKHCNGNWEASHKIEIDTLDNPGWFLTVDIKNTDLENKPFEKINIDRSAHDWLCCFTEEGKFMGPCGPSNLPEVLQIFRNWVES